MKKYTKTGIAIISAIMALGLASCKSPFSNNRNNENQQETEVEVTEVTCTEQAKNLYIGDTYKLTVGVKPENATDKTLTFASNDKNIVSVDAEGTITAIAKGTALVSITSKNGKAAYVAVSVTERPVEIVQPTSIEVDFESAELVIGDKKQINATILPANAENKNVDYITDNKSIATVSNTGLITAVGAGEANITAYSQANPAISKTIKVTVLTNVVDVSSVTAAKSRIDLLVGATETIEYTVLPENATNKNVEFVLKQGSDEFISVNDAGLVTAKKAGTGRVYVISESNRAIRVEVDVVVSNEHTAVAGIVLSSSSVTIAPNSTYQIVASVLPEDATNKKLTYSSNNDSVATVSTSGLVTAGTNEGVASITIVSEDDPSIFKILTVNVANAIVPVESVAINEGTGKTVNISEANSFTLTTTILPANASDTSIKWSSDNVSIATVNQSGLVTPTGKTGEVHITAESISNSACTSTYTLVVNEVLVESISFEVNTVSVSTLDFVYPDIEAGTTKTLTAVVLPENANDKAISWSSSNSLVASVTNGVVKPIALGTTVIRATNLHSGVYKDITVNVKSIDVTAVNVFKSGVEVSSLNYDSRDLNTAKDSLTATVEPANATNKNIIWSSLTPSICTINNGVVTPVGFGIGAVRATSEDNPLIYKDVNVVVGEIMVESISLRHNGIDIDGSIEFSTKDIGDSSKSYQVDALVNPGYAYDADLSWNIQDATVASVTTSGLVSPLKEGTTKLIVTNSRSGVSAELVINVVKPVRYVASLPISVSEAFSTYEANRRVKANKLEEFNDRDQIYKVGNKNCVNLMPKFNVKDLENGGANVDSTYWAYDFGINVEKLVESSYVAAPATEFAIRDARNCDIQFNPAAIGNIYRVTITLGNAESICEDAEDFEDATAVYNFKVVDGFNVYREDELSYFDTTTAWSYTESGISYILSGETRGRDEGGMPRTVVDYPTFKLAHNLDPSLIVNNIVLHKNLTIKPENLAPGLFYSANEATFVEANQQDKTVGTLKDYIALYMHNTNQNVNVEGNYFKIDYKNVPLITRPFGRIESSDNKLDSHSAFFKVTNGETTIQNINVEGNAHNAKDDTGLKYAGGLFFLKGTDASTNTNLKNIISHGQYITMMNERASDVLGDSPVIKVENLKAYDHYNTFLYNWGGALDVKNSYFEGSGGPAVIQDHTAVDTDMSDEEDAANIYYSNTYREFDATHPYKAHGNPPISVFTDCEFENNLLGTEAWFNSFPGATSIAAQMKALNDGLIYAASGNTKTFLRSGSNGNYTPALAANGAATMNFLVLNKSSNAQGVTVDLVDGNTTFINTNSSTTETLNYFNPGEGAEYSSTEGQLYKAFADAQNSGNVVVETASGALKFDLGTGSPTALRATSMTPLNGGNYIALYLNGMMLVFRLYNV